LRGTFKPALDLKSEGKQSDSISAQTQHCHDRSLGDMVEEIMPKTKKKRNKKSKKQQVN